VKPRQKRIQGEPDPPQPHARPNETAAESPGGRCADNRASLAQSISAITLVATKPALQGLKSGCYSDAARR
jgi:hypothetical protein